jgi:hypothetical protein
LIVVAARQEQPFAQGTGFPITGVSLAGISPVGL